MYFCILSLSLHWTEYHECEGFVLFTSWLTVGAQEISVGRKTGRQSTIHGDLKGWKEAGSLPISECI